MRILLLVLLCLTSCAPTYVATGAGPGTDEMARDDYKACAKIVTDDYLENTPFYEREGFIAGLLGGPIFGGIYAATTAKSDPEGNGIEGKVKDCMVKRGYVVKKETSP